jgi:branched-chain amino acid transport system permease protein
VVELIWGADPRPLHAWLPQFDASIAGVKLPSDRVMMLAVVLLVLAAFGFLFTRTRFGIALRAMATDRETAALVGIPVGRLSVAAWAGTAALATLSMLLIAPSRGLDPGGLTLVVIPGLAAAVIGDLRNPVAIVAGGLALGVIEAEAGLAQWTAENDQIVPFVVLLVVLLWRQRKIATPAISELGRA